MNKIITAESTLNNIRALCAERDRKEQERLRANRLDRDKKKLLKKKEYRAQTVF